MARDLDELVRDINDPAHEYLKQPTYIELYG
jgi:hypothetical protein